jgi:RNA polymerase sigma-70 factor (ECF subfamily)
MIDETERALDGYLVALIQGGSREAFDRLARRWTPRLVRYATRVLGRPEVARDVVQETWIGVIRGLRRLDDPAQFPAWIYSITHKKCVDGIRLNQRQRRLKERVEQETAISAVEDSIGKTRDVATAISHLSDAQRDVVHLFYGEGLPVNEIASILGIPPGTVKSRLHHARQTLKKLAGE